MRKNGKKQMGGDVGRKGRAMVTGEAQWRQEEQEMRRELAEAGVDVGDLGEALRQFGAAVDRRFEEELR